LSIPEKFKVIFFDFDGVIVESNNLKKEAFFEVFQTYEDKIELVYEYEKKNGPLSRFQKFQDLKKILNVEESGIENTWANLYSELTLKKVISCDYVNGAIDFLDKASAVYPIHLLSNTPQVDLDIIVKERGLQKYFKTILGSPIVKSEALEQFKNQNNYSRQDVLFVGDNLTDMEAAHASDVQFIGRFSGAAFPDNEIVVKDLHELSEMILD